MTDLLLLLVNVSDLEPDVDLGERTRGVLEDKFEALEGEIGRKRELRNEMRFKGKDRKTHVERVRVLVLLLVDDAESEVDLVSFVEV